MSYARSVPFSRGSRILEERRGRQPASICFARTSSATRRRDRMGPRRRQQRFCNLVRPSSRDAGRHERAHRLEPSQQLRLAAQRRRAPLRRGRVSKPPFTRHLDGQRRVRQQLRFGRLLPSSGHPHAMAHVRARPRPLSGPHALPASLAPWEAPGLHSLRPPLSRTRPALRYPRPTSHTKSQAMSRAIEPSHEPSHTIATVRRSAPRPKRSDHRKSFGAQSPIGPSTIACVRSPASVRRIQPAVPSRHLIRASS